MIALAEKSPLRGRGREASNHLTAALLAIGKDSFSDEPTRYTVDYIPRQSYSERRADQPPRPSLPPLPTWDAGPDAKTLVDLDAGECKFPVGDAEGFNQLFCAAPRADGRPYCRTCLMRLAGKISNPKVLN